MRHLIEAIIRDTWYGVRQMVRNPGFAVPAVLTLAIGIGGVTAVYSFVHGVVLNPLPYGEPERLVRVAVRLTGAFAGTRIPPEENWPVRQRVFEDVLRFTTQGVTLLDAEDPVALRVPEVPIRFATFLDVDPTMGRSFAPGDFSDPPSVALVTHGFWTNRLGADPDAIGTPIRTDLGIITVVGVMPRDFVFYYASSEVPPEMFVPGEANGGVTLARVRRGMTVDAAEAELARLVDEIGAEFPGASAREVELIRLVDDAVGADWARVLLLFLGAVSFVLVIAIVNVANLTLTRSVSREREVAIRSAIGSTRPRLVGQFLVESATLALAGGILGVLMAHWGLTVVLGLLPAGFPRADEVGVDMYALLVAVGIILVAGVCFGIGQVWACSALDVNRSLKDGDRGASDSNSRRRFRSVLVVAEVALATILLTGGFLLARSFADLVGTPLGMNVENVISVNTRLSPSRYDSSARDAFRNELSERLRLRPDVEAVSLSNVGGMSAGLFAGLTINGRRAESVEDGTPLITGEAGIFDVLGIEFVEGRRYREGEDTAVVVTESFAARHYPDVTPLGQEISYTGATMTVVGVARDFRLDGPVEEPVPAVIAPIERFQLYLLVRTSGDPRVVMNAIRGEVRALDPEVVVDQETLEEAMYALNAISQPRLRAVTVTTFGVVSLLLSLVGIAGVASNAAARRTPEIGVRMALGGTRTAIMRMLLVQTMMPVIAGVTIGALGAAALTRVLSAYVADLSTIDPVAFVLAATVLVVTAVVATYIPLRKIAGIHPIAAIRYE